MRQRLRVPVVMERSTQDPLTDEDVQLQVLDEGVVAQPRHCFGLGRIGRPRGVVLTNERGPGLDHDLQLEWTALEPAGPLLLRRPHTSVAGDALGGPRLLLPGRDRGAQNLPRLVDGHQLHEPFRAAAGTATPAVPPALATLPPALPTPRPDSPSLRRSVVAGSPLDSASCGGSRFDPTSRPDPSALASRGTRVGHRSPAHGLGGRSTISRHVFDNVPDPLYWAFYCRRMRRGGVADPRPKRAGRLTTVAPPANPKHRLQGFRSGVWMQTRCATRRRRHALDDLLRLIVLRGAVVLEIDHQLPDWRSCTSVYQGTRRRRLRRDLRGGDRVGRRHPAPVPHPHQDQAGAR